MPTSKATPRIEPISTISSGYTLLQEELTDQRMIMGTCILLPRLDCLQPLCVIQPISSKISNHSSCASNRIHTRLKWDKLRVSATMTRRCCRDGRQQPSKRVSNNRTLTCRSLPLSMDTGLDFLPSSIIGHLCSPCYVLTVAEPGLTEIGCFLIMPTRLSVQVPYPCIQRMRELVGVEAWTDQLGGKYLLG